MDWDKIKAHKKSFLISESWLVEANFTKDELNYITGTFKQPSIEKSSKPKLKYLSAKQSGKIESYNIKQG